MSDSDPAPTIVQCRSLTKSYGSGATTVNALRGVDLDVRAGEVVMLMGPSGCGKTTLLSVLGGLLKADAGSCRILGDEIGELSPSACAALRSRAIGFVFQAFNLIPALTVLDNVSVPLILSGHNRGAAEAHARAVIETVGIDDKLDSLPGQLSGGQRQRVAIARAIVHEPAVILCDEPTSALDQRTGRAVMEVLFGAARTESAALIIVTHDARITQFADRVLEMEDGIIISGASATAKTVL